MEILKFIKEMGKNKNLHKAKKEKNDEFYTQLADIENELGHYKKHFKGKVVFLNCDDPVESNFFVYFVLNFKFLGLKKIIATHFEETKPSYTLIVNKDINDDGIIDLKDAIRIELKQNGDFRSPECIEFLKEADIVVTNPPFSLFREYIAQLMEYGKKFLIIGNILKVDCKEIFPWFKENKIWFGCTTPKQFIQPDGSMKKFGNTCWYTNLSHKKRNEKIILYKKYNKKEYPKYDNYKAIETVIGNKTIIPKDFEGEMAVPCSFLLSYNPEQFKIIGHMHSADVSNETESLRTNKTLKHRGFIDGEQKQPRIIIRRKK